MNVYADLKPLIPQALEKLPTIRPGEIHRIES